MAELTDDQLDQLAECLPDCIEIYGPYRPRHAPECRHDDLAELVAEVRRLREARHADLRLLLQAGRDLTDSEAERDRLRGLLGALASLAEEAKRHVPHDTDLRSDLDADLAGVRALLDDQEDDRG